MAQQAPLEPGSALYELAQNLDLAKVPEKLVCKNCSQFLLNAFKTACCDGSLCEKCNTAAVGTACPYCKHNPLISNPSKALRGTARNYLKSLASAEASKTVETTPSLLPAETENITSNGHSQENDERRDLVNEQPPSDAIQATEESGDRGENEDAVNGDAVEVTEETMITSRRLTMDSASGNEPDDDIEINVGPDYDLSQVPAPESGPVDEEQWLGDDSAYQDRTRKDSMRPQKQERNNSFALDNNVPDMNQQNMPPEAMMFQNGMTPQMMNMNSNDFMQMQNNFMSAMSNMPMTPMMANMMQGMPNMQNMFSMMQNMGMPMPIGMAGNQNWGANMMPFGNQNFNSMMNNAASFNQGQGQGQQFQSFQNGNFRDNRQGNFRGGRGRKRGRGGFWQQHDQFNNFNNIPFQNQYSQGSVNSNHNPYENQQQQDNDQTNDVKENDHHPDDDEFAPGGQDEVQEALGDSYTKRKSQTPEPAAIETPIEETKQDSYQREPSLPHEEPQSLVDSPKQEPKEADIPEAYREDLDFAAIPPTAPSGPSAKDVPYRARGHGRFPSRGRGSFHGSNPYPPRSPARPVSQHQNHSPTTSQGTGVVGAPTGPRAMREKDAPPVKSLSRSESDVGFKIRGTATQPKDTRPKDEAPRSATPRSGLEDYDDRDSRRTSRHERRYETIRNDYQQDDDYAVDRERKRRKPRREDDYDMQDAEHPYSRSDSQDRDSSYRNGRRDKDKPRDKYSSSRHKPSSRRHDEEDYDENTADRYDEEPSRSSRPKKPSRHEDRDERRDRDYERAEKDKHRKRSRHDRDYDDGYEDADEEESRRRSRKHKKEHTSSRKDRERDRDRDRERERDEDLGMRITGRSSHRDSEAETRSAPTAQPDKDPHMSEREARNQERMLKEKQRREAAKTGGAGSLSGGRTRNVKYEDELEVRSYGKSSRRR